MTQYYLDDEWEDHVITSVSAGDSWYSIQFREPHEAAGGMGIGVPIADCEAVGVVPKEGDAFRLCGAFGRPCRGMIINDALIYYRTEAEEHAKWEREVAERQTQRRREFDETGRAVLDAKYDALPPIFQARIDKFRHNNPDFRWEFESYEMFCCEEAVKLARHLGTVDAMTRYASLTRCSITAEEVRWYREREEQKAIDKAAGLSNDHSGNTHGAAVALASLFLNNPASVEKMHGALAPLVGSFAYGCVPPDEAV